MAVVNLREWTLGLHEDVEEQRESHRNRTQAAMLYAIQNLVLGSRVDTGRFRGNWQVTEGEPATGFAWDSYDFAGRLGTRDTLSDESARVLQASGDDIIWAHNGLPYAHILDDMDAIVAGTVAALETWLDSAAGQAPTGSGGVSQ